MKKLICLITVLMIFVSFATVPALADNGENIALDKEAECEAEDPETVASNEGLVFFSSAFLTDGDIPEAWDGSDMPLCWYGGAKTRDAEITITIDLEGIYAINKIIVYPTVFLNGQNMPSDYKVLVSKDKSDWKQVGEEVGLAGEQTNPFVYETNEEGQYIRILITKMSIVADAFYFYAGIAEIEAYGDLIAAPTKAPTAEPTATPVPSENTPGPTASTTNSTTTDTPDGDTKDSEFPVVPVAIACAAAVVVVAVIVFIVKKKKA